MKGLFKHPTIIASLLQYLVPIDYMCLRRVFPVEFAKSPDPATFIPVGCRVGLKLLCTIHGEPFPDGGDLPPFENDVGSKLAGVKMLGGRKLFVRNFEDLLNRQCRIDADKYWSSWFVVNMNVNPTLLAVAMWSSWRTYAQAGYTVTVRLIGFNLRDAVRAMEERHGHPKIVLVNE